MKRAMVFVSAAAALFAAAGPTGGNVSGARKADIKLSGPVILLGLKLSL